MPDVGFNAVHKAILDNYFKKSSADPSLYILDSEARQLWLLVYMDDLLLVSPSTVVVDAINCVLMDTLNVKDIGEAVYYLSMNIRKNRITGEMWLSHSKYASQVVSKFGLAHTNSGPSPLPSNFKDHRDSSTIEHMEGELQNKGEENSR